MERSRAFHLNFSGQNVLDIGVSMYNVVPYVSGSVMGKDGTVRKSKFYRQDQQKEHSSVSR